MAFYWTNKRSFFEKQIKISNQLQNQRRPIQNIMRWMSEIDIGEQEEMGEMEIKSSRSMGERVKENLFCSSDEEKIVPYDHVQCSVFSTIGQGLEI